MCLVQAVNVVSAGFIAAHTAIIYELLYYVTKVFLNWENDVKIKIQFYPFLRLIIPVLEEASNKQDVGLW